MRRWMMGLMVMVVVSGSVVGLAPVPVVSAQYDTAECVYYFPTGGSTVPFYATFGDCAAYVYTSMTIMSQGEGYGAWGYSWGYSELYVTGQGDVYADGVYMGNLFDMGSDSDYGGSGGGSPGNGGTDGNNGQPSRQDDNWDIDELVEYVSADLDLFWSSAFEAGGFIYYTPDVVLTTRASLSTACGDWQEEMGPVYCAMDNTVYLPEFFLDIAQREIGDFAAAIIIAHEWGHAVQANLGILQNIDYINATSTYPVNLEIQADCLAGAYAAYASYCEGYVCLDPGDLEEGAEQMWEVGSDYDALTVWFNPRAHGRPEQRVEAYSTGLNYGYGACN
ncbi:MAG: hypothetical protein GYB65_02560 [Chloroflexi bacterium]|nr:hypothetical protein [Chloroflexota bacterium]